MFKSRIKSGRNITWNPGAKRSPQATQSRRLKIEPEIPPELKEVLAASMVPGALFAIVADLQIEKLNRDIIAPPHPVLRACLVKKTRYPVAPPNVTVPIASIAIYMGQHRCEEQGRHGKVRVVRHAFLVGSAIYIIPDLNWVRPVDTA